MLLIVGHKGNMGKRYQQVCRDLGIKFRGVDLDDKIAYDGITHILIATPTHTHKKMYDRIRKRFSGLILCEKPFSKNLDEIIPVYDDENLFIVNNYQYIKNYNKPKKDDIETVYRYFNSGKDGIHFDCIQMYYLAKDEVRLSHDTAVWQCRINGSNISRFMIDVSYIYMIEHFMYGKIRFGYDRKKYYEAHLQAKRATNNDIQG